MKVIGLISGGKDSCHNLTLCQELGHEIVALGNLCPSPSIGHDDLHSWMFQTVGHEVIQSYAACTGLPLYQAVLSGYSKNVDMMYEETDGDEVEDLYRLLACAKNQIPDLEGVSCGAIASDYQRIRVEAVCQRLKLTSLAFMWKQPQLQLFDDMISKGIHAILIKVAVMGLDPHKNLGQSLTEARSRLLHLNAKYGVNICGEGGEYETLVLDSPFFTFASIHTDTSSVVLDPDGNTIVPSGMLKITAFHLEAKDAATSIPDPQVIQVPSSIPCLSAKHQPSEIRLDPKDLDYCVEKSQHFLMMKVRSKSEDCSNMRVLFWNAFLEVKGEMERQNLSMDHVLFVSIYLHDMSNFSLMNEIYSQIFPKINPPSRLSIQLDITTSPFYLEILALNTQHVQKDDLSVSPLKKVLHVQSRSYWATNCIGPYSQATSIQNLIFMAGMIGLNPATMSFHGVDLEQEVKFAFEHCQAVAEAMGAELVTFAVRCVIYVTQELIEDFQFIEEGGLLSTMMEAYLPTSLWWKGKVESRHSLNCEDVDMGLCPLVTVIQVPALPKNGHIEVHPILLNPCQLMHSNFNMSMTTGLTNTIFQCKAKSEKLGICVTYSLGNIKLEHNESSTSLVYVMDCGRPYCMLLVTFSKIPDMHDQKSENTCISKIIQYLNCWLETSGHSVDEIFSFIACYTIPESSIFLTKLLAQLNWRQGTLVPSKRAKLIINSNNPILSIIEIQFTSAYENIHSSTVAYTNKQL